MIEDSETIPLDQKVAMKTARTRLEQEFSTTLRLETIDEVLQSCYETLRHGASIRQHLPLLAERFARSALDTMAQVKNRPEGVRTIAFLDHHDAGRAKIAKHLLLNLVGEDRVLVVTAGTSPANEIDPAVLEVMAEEGVNLSQSFPKPLTGTWLTRADAVVVLRTTGLPDLPQGVEFEEWHVPRPSNDDPEAIRQLRDEIERRVEDLANRLGLTP